MSDNWFFTRPSSGPAVEAQQLNALRTLLRKDYLARADWDYALRDLAGMVRNALEAQEALVALWDEAEGRWTAVTGQGLRLEDHEIALHGSRTLLERVRESGQPLFTVDAQPLELESDSIARHELHSALVVPLYWWDVTEFEPRRQLSGCLYAHRGSSQPPFHPPDVDLVRDIALIAQPVLNMLRCLRATQLELESSRREVQALRRATGAASTLGGFSTRDPGLEQRVLEPLRRVRNADRVNVLILGPTGSGKSHLAEAFHVESGRRDGPFVVLDCAQVTSVETLGAELFGYAPDSGYANAPRGGRPGKAQLAHRGTLFIDEIACLPPDLQQKLLRLVERGTFSPLGSSEQRAVDLQVVAATHEDLAALVAHGRFREDLYWRISDVTLHLPPLSARRADIPELAQRFLERAAERTGRHELCGIRARAMKVLVAHDWGRSGNIRGLERTMYRSALLSPPGTRYLDEEQLRLQDLAAEPVAKAPVERVAGVAPPLALPGTRVGRDSGSAHLETIKAAIRTHGYASAAARALGLSYRELTWQLHKVGLSVRDVLAERE